MHNAFHQNQYQQVVDFDTSSFSSTNALPARILKLRAKVAIGEAAAVAKELASQNSPIDLVAVRTLAESVAEGPEAEGPKNKALELSQSHGDNLSVQLCAGTVLANAGLREEAVNLLSKHQGSLDAYVSLVNSARSGRLTGDPQRCTSYTDPPVSQPPRPRSIERQTSQAVGSRLSAHQHRRVVGQPPHWRPGELPVCILRLRRACHRSINLFGINHSWPGGQ